MSDTQPTRDERSASVEVDVPADPLAGHPATAYFWGHVAGSGTVSTDGIDVVTTDETSAEVLAAVAGGDLDRETVSRDYAHDTSITRTEDEYTLSIGGDESGVLGRNSVLGLPVDGRGNYRFEAFAGYEQELLRGLLEGCGTICFKSSSGTVGISFVHDDRQLLELTRELIAGCPVDAPCGELSETASGGYWFGVDDDVVPEFGTWLYEDCTATGLFAPSRRRKLERSLEQADAYDT
ncbi:cobalamin biosynthesis protein [Natronolimnohabitans sp. A-GB9]|uniref:cobalamin biosynthesis protein n=1 Tax=Natronolimnohabitans sp. A-GB9 TaxID=3069757 RepID=UPI0027B447AB|nr:cobalamin biosynthesis protein [Natronolimnohabitans sp. A-GB9]MDQ2051420.1 cobalamin biosynthesis protein [Natronolimnohabitans sp. A-GB9]